MRIAILGTRGIPANYGGFETFAEALSERLVSRGHDVTVYGRSNFINQKNKIYKGVKIVVLPALRNKYLDTPSNTFLATLHVLFKRYDVLLYCNSANSVFTLLPRLLGRRVVLNVDGLEWKRAKWNRFGRAVYRISEYLATILPNRIVTDAKAVRRYYKDRFNKSSTYIPYGTPIGRMGSSTILEKFGLEKEGYILYVSRLEPENNAHVVVKAFEDVDTELKLVVVGDAPYSSEYIKNLKETTDPRIIFTGYIFGEGYREFQSNAYFYVQATEVGGTHPALVEAMGHGNCILANDVPEHREVLGRAGHYFSVKDPGSLADRMRFLIEHPEEVERCRREAEARALRLFTWERVTSDYERLFLKIKAGRAR